MDQKAYQKRFRRLLRVRGVKSRTDEIEQYVLSLCKGYFRTTKKASLGLDSLLSDHGLDSLDAIELII